MPRFRLAREAEADIQGIAAWSQARFGDESRRRYVALIAAAILDVAEDPDRVGHALRPELGQGLRAWHIRASRRRSREGTVRRPRHVLIYRLDGDIIEIVRVLHDNMDPHMHVGPSGQERDGEIP